MKLSQILAVARNLIAQGWTQKTYARDKDGRPTPFGGPAATCWCASGAVQHAAADGFRAREALRIFRTATGGWPVAPWNDEPTRTQDGVLEAFDIAINLALEEEAV